MWAPIPGSWNIQRNIWAPHVEAGDDGRFHLDHSANGRIGVAVDDTPTGPFEEVLGHPLVGDGYGPGDGAEGAIDAFVLRASDGSLTFYYTASVPLNSNFGVPMVDHTALGEGPATLLTRPEGLPWV